jgi:hypothetical protein
MQFVPAQFRAQTAPPRVMPTKNIDMRLRLKQAGLRYDRLLLSAALLINAYLSACN